MIDSTAVISEDVVVGQNVQIGKKVTICSGCIIGNDVIIGDNTYIDHGTIIRNNVEIGEESYIGARSILGEYLVGFVSERKLIFPKLKIGTHATIRSEAIIYGDCVIGDYFQTGHRITIREKSKIGNHVRIGTLSDLQGYCSIGDYSSLHSNVHVGQKSKIGKYVMIFPYVVLTNDPTPPSRPIIGVEIDDFAVIATGTVLLPGVHVATDCLVGACAVVTKDVEPETIVVGNPGKNVGNVRKIKNKFSGETVYPWRYSFDEKMPWEGIGYDEWISSVDSAEKEYNT